MEGVAVAGEGCAGPIRRAKDEGGVVDEGHLLVEKLWAAVGDWNDRRTFNAGGARAIKVKVDVDAAEVGILEGGDNFGVGECKQGD